MEVTSPKPVERRATSEPQCPICGAWRKWDDLCCENMSGSGLDPRHYVELFWDEA